MVTQAAAAPVTYLNKGEEYRLTITDTDPPPHPSDRFRARYRTHVAIAFHREDQRSDSDAHWRLWRARRGLSGEGQYDEEGGGGTGSGSRCAIELCVDKLRPVGTGLNAEGINDRGQNVQLETSSFNGFCVLWSCNRLETGTSPSMLPLPECTITVRFNFLTTDFCHYKGVKGFPVRLCARTEIVTDNLGKSSPVSSREESAAAEVCYCKVNLFRMYGAERKLAADAAGVRKAREKVCREIQKRQPNPGSYTSKNGGTRTSLGSEAAGEVFMNSGHKKQMRILEQLQEKLASLQAMLSSARPVTVFSLRGDASDTPDWSTDDHSAQYKDASALYGDRQSTISGQDCPDESSSSSSAMSYPWGTNLLLGPENPSPSDTQDETRSNQAVRVSRNRFEDEKMRYIEVLDIDPNYQPPAQQQSQSVACFYIGFAGTIQTHADYHVAVYLTEWTAHSLIEGISGKLGIDPRRVYRVLLVRGNSLQAVDDSVVRGIVDGQDMLAEILERWAFDCASENLIEIRLRY
ncbi:CP2 transcription factor-domain-containing protein [Aspergillus pseudodeflectus]|uniref:CP2 transcription factor-domain-containing protein n=1 Tax=Aspergillus pseudodeflectus TaxID=176178 RepID=A0ABR4KXX8_9EURO